MPSVVQRTAYLNEVAEEEVEFDFDAFTAWRFLRRMIEQGQPMPQLAQQYFLDAAIAVDAFDPDEDDGADLVRVLHVQHSPRAAIRKRKSQVDYDDIYWSISRWMAEGQAKGVTQAKCIRRYIDEKEQADEPLDFDTVRSAYNTVRRERIAATDQERPHFKMPDSPNKR